MAGIQLARASAVASFVVGGSALLLVFIGIHNAWDTVMYVMLERVRERKARTAATAAAVTPAAERRPDSESTPAGTDVEPSGPRVP